MGTTIPTTTSVTLIPATVTFGTRVVYLVTVAPRSGTGTPTGKVTFSTGTKTLCKAVLLRRCGCLRIYQSSSGNGRRDRNVLGWWRLCRVLWFSHPQRHKFVALALPGIIFLGVFYEPGCFMA